jgi:anti-anti-sigma regulatory factor
LCVACRVIIHFSEQPPVLRCCGDEDLATQACRRAALSRALRADDDVIVDLRDLSFADTSLMLDLALVARRLRAGGRQLRLRDPQAHVGWLIEMVGLPRLPGVVVDQPTPALT